jgi:hypothetical protein
MAPTADDLPDAFVPVIFNSLVLPLGDFAEYFCDLFAIEQAVTVLFGG